MKGKELGGELPSLIVAWHSTGNEKGKKIYMGKWFSILYSNDDVAQDTNFSAAALWVKKESQKI